MMDKQQFKNSGLLEQYVLGLTSPEENQIVEEFVNTYPDIKKELDGFRNAMEQYAQQHAVPPPPRLKKTILKSIDDLENAPLAKASNKWYQNLGLVLAMIATLVFGILALIESQGKKAYQKQLSVSQTALSTLQEDCASQLAKYQAIADMSGFIQDPSTRKVNLKGSGLVPNAQAIAYWNEDQSKGYLNLGSLPEPPAGKTYQLWADVEGVMIDAGVVKRTPQNQLIAVNFIEHAESLNITLEPEGGSTAPTVAFLQANAYL